MGCVFGGLRGRNQAGLRVRIIVSHWLQAVGLSMAGNPEPILQISTLRTPILHPAAFVVTTLSLSRKSS